MIPAHFARPTRWLASLLNGYNGSLIRHPDDAAPVRVHITFCHAQSVLVHVGGLILGPHFSCFTSKKVQILTQKRLVGVEYALTLSPLSPDSGVAPHSRVFRKDMALLPTEELVRVLVRLRDVFASDLDLKATYHLEITVLDSFPGLGDEEKLVALERKQVWPAPAGYLQEVCVEGSSY